jgi:heme/copper-type cytochrome/quinol oxidase subunit 2
VIGISMLAVLFVIALAIFLVLSICAVLMQLTRGNSSGRHAVAMVLLALIAVPVGLVMFLALVRSNVSMEQQEATLSPPQPLPDLPQIREVPPPAEVPPPVNLPPVRGL